MGRAYDAMTARQYCELTGADKGEDGWQKPSWSDVDQNGDVKRRMVCAGCDALSDAFSVMIHERVFNIWNMSDKRVEEFNPQNAGQYSQSQCAIVIERVFSRLYKYLHFKTTTGEVLPRHVNIDSGYKYLTPESIAMGDAKDDGDAKP